VRRRIGGAALLLAVVVTTVVAAGARPAAADETLPAVRRVLVISLPGVTWSDIEDNDLPALRSVIDQAAVANLAVRVVSLKTNVSDGYATVGSGTRAIARRDDAGLAFEPHERVEADDAAAVYERITGRRLTGIAGQVHLPELKISNIKSRFDAKLSALGDALAKAGVSRGVVANADVAPESTDLSSYHREAFLSLMDSNGQLPCGTVGTELLQKDETAPFGVSLDPAAVDRDAVSCLRGRSVVLVEGSDLTRAERYSARLTKTRFETLWRDALHRTDRMVAGLLSHVDAKRDAVIVMAPSAPQTTKPQLTVFAVRAPGLEAGLLESSVTRQSGFVSIVDVAPTIATLVRAPLDEADIEGRAVSVSKLDGDATERVNDLVGANKDAMFRDRIMSTFMSTYIAIILVIAMLAAVSMRWKKKWRWLEPLALGALAVLPLTYWAALMPFPEWGTGAYFAFTLLGGLAIGIAADAMRRWFAWPVVVVLIVMIVTTAISVVLLDSRLQLSTVFGDSPIVAGRFEGINNVTFSQLMVAAILLAGFIRLAGERRGEWSKWVVLVFLFAVLLLDGAPMWGADVGGVLAGVPALALTFTLLAGWRVRIRTVATWVLATVVVIVGLGLLDLTRDPSHRTHLGRLFENIGQDGSSGFTTVVHRKLNANLATLTTSVWRWVVAPIVVLVAYLVWRMPPRLAALRRRIPVFDACFYGIIAAAVLGYALNDSGIAVPGVMLAVLTLATVYMLNRVDDPVPEPVVARADAA
jgi:hypothetical protein